MWPITWSLTAPTTSRPSSTVELTQCPKEQKLQEQMCRTWKRPIKRDKFKRRVSKVPIKKTKHWPKAVVLSITASKFLETGVALESLDPDLREFCERQNISIVVDEDSSNDMDSNSSSSEDHECLDSFEEIVKPSELKLFSIFLKKTKGAVLEGQHTWTSRRTYTGHSWTTQYHRRKLCTDHISKGFLPMDQYM